MLTKEQKHEQSLLLRENLDGVTTLFLLENHGLNVNDVNSLRSEVRKSDATYKVVKNTVVRLAVEGTEMEGITPFLTGPKVLAYTGGDGVALAKVLKDFIKKHPELQFEQALITKLAYLLQSPIRRLAVALNAPLQYFANVIGQLAEKDEEPQETQDAQEAEGSSDADEPQEAQEAEGSPEAEEAQGVQDVEGASEAGEEAKDDREAEESQEAQEAQVSQENQESKES
ncbi:MAG: 50S ribosomal protein L10 [Acidobacteria bacterium]|nr:50S ribosomal protein L10 [Candidatus Sulfomarinibacter kjeldsenii]